MEPSENIIYIYILSASLLELSSWDDPINIHKIFSGNIVTLIILSSATGAVWSILKEINKSAKIINPCRFITDL